MRINHEKTYNNILEVVKLLNAQGNSAKNYLKEYHEIVDGTDHSQEYKNRKTEELMVAYYEGYGERKKAIREVIGKIAEDEAINDAIVELDVPEYSNTVAIIRATEGKLPHEFIKNIKDNFAGNYNAISSIVALLEFYGLKPDSYGFKEYARHSSDALNEIDIMVGNLERSQEAVFLDLRMIYEKIVTFGKVRGLMFSDEVLNDDALRDEVAEEEIAKRVMGIK